MIERSVYLYRLVKSVSSGRVQCEIRTRTRFKNRVTTAISRFVVRPRDVAVNVPLSGTRTGIATETSVRATETSRRGRDDSRTCLHATISVRTRVDTSTSSTTDLPRRTHVTSRNYHATLWWTSSSSSDYARRSTLIVLATMRRVRTDMHCATVTVVIVASLLTTSCWRGRCDAMILTGVGGTGGSDGGDIFGAGRGPSPLIVNPTGLQPRFMSSSHTYKLVVGDTVLLPCEVKNLGSFVLVWRKGATLLSAGSTMVSLDNRLQLMGNGAIQLRSVSPADAGDYHCQIGDGSHGDLHHTLEILVPPTVAMSPANGHVTARKGGTVTFECKASGNPSPRIEWTKKSGLLPTGEHSVSGFALTLTGIERTDAGTYQCTASNGVGQSVSSTVQLHVLFPPEVTTDRSWIKTVDGIEAQLSCVVHADPPAEVHWYQDSFPLDPTDRRTMEARGNTYTLIIRHVQNSDFGNYSCLVENSLGRTKKYVELSGRPGPIHFMGAPYSRWPNSYNITFRVDSMAPLQEVRLLYRKVMINDTYHSPGKWHDVLLTPTYAETVTYQMSYNIRDLEPSSVFEIIIQAKNRYGWNEISDMHQFYTRGYNEVVPSNGQHGNGVGYDGVEDLGLVSAAGRAGIAAAATAVSCVWYALTAV